MTEGITAMKPTTRSTPEHLLPDHCYVCGCQNHGDTFTRTGEGHNFCSNADAERHFKDEAPHQSVRYSSGATTPEAAYVAEYRPY